MCLCCERKEFEIFSCLMRGRRGREQKEEKKSSFLSESKKEAKKNKKQLKRRVKKEKRETQKEFFFKDTNKFSSFFALSLSRKNSSLKKRLRTHQEDFTKTLWEERAQKRERDDVFFRRRKQRDGGSSGKEIHRWSDRLVRHAGTNWMCIYFMRVRRVLLCASERRGGLGNRFFASSSFTSSSSSHKRSRYKVFWPLSLRSLSLCVTC